MNYNVGEKVCIYDFGKNSKIGIIVEIRVGETLPFLIDCNGYLDTYADLEIEPLTEPNDLIKSIL